MRLDRALARVDHLVFAAPTLPAAVARVERLLGVRPADGGRHPEWGTRNAILSLGPAAYLEVIGPDPERKDPEPPRLFGIGALDSPRLVTWAAKADRLERRVREAAASGVELGPPRPGSRRTPDDRTLAWRLTDPLVVAGDGLVPFLIDWAGEEHPARRAPRAGRLVGLRGLHPRPDRIRALCAAVGLDLPVDPAPAPGLRARIRTDSAEVELS